MGKLYRDRDEIAIPDEAYVNTYDGRVYVKRSDEGGKERRIMIGRASTDTTMVPNETFRALFPSLWEATYGRDMTDRLAVSVGTYAMLLGAGLKTGAYAIAQSVYGLDAGNALMDYAMFSLLESDPTQLLFERLADEVTFCPVARSDSWYKDLFATLGDDRHARLKEAWLKRCVELGVSDVWLCVDDTVDLPGCDDGETMAYVEAVDARDGRPVTYFALEHGFDGKALQEAVLFLTQWNVMVKGVVLGRGLCTPSVVRTLRELDIDFVIALPKDTLGYRSAFSELADEIYWGTAHMVSADGVFGSSISHRIWDGCEDEAHVNLFFLGADAVAQSKALMLEVGKAMDEAKEALVLGRTPGVEESMAPFVQLVEDEDGRVTDVAYDHDAWSAALAEAGYLATISSTGDMGPKEVWDAWRLRDEAQGQRSVPESLRRLAGRTRTAASVRSALAAGFLAHVLHHEVRLSCETLGLDVAEMVEEIDDIHLLRTGAGIYTPVRRYTADQTALLSALGVSTEDFVGIAQDFSQRLADPTHDQRHHLPERKPPHRKGRGRTKGSKNRKTLEREAEIERRKAAGTYVEPPKRGPGRPKGSKDTKPRKKRSDAGVRRGPRKPKAEETASQDEGLT